MSTTTLYYWMELYFGYSRLQPLTLPQFGLDLWGAQMERKWSANTAKRSAIKSCTRNTTGMEMYLIHPIF